MGWWTSLKWVASEGTGAGVNRRLVQFLGRTWRNAGTRAPATPRLVRRFLASANIVIDRFGPAWTRRKIQSQPLGVWLLMFFWTVPSLAFAFAVFVRAKSQPVSRIGGGSACQTVFKNRK